MTPQEVWYRDAETEDVNGIMVLWREYATRHATLDPAFIPSEDGAARYRKTLTTLLEGGDSMVRLAGRDDEIVGYCFAAIMENQNYYASPIVGFVWDLVVLPAMHRKGLGSRLLKDAITWFKSNGIVRIETSANAMSRVEQSFFEKHGFRPYSKLYRINA